MIDTNEQHFNINNVLKNLFIALRKLGNEKNIELIYDMDMHIPKELRGNDKALLTLLTRVLTFIFNASDEKEIMLSLSAPEDFLYEEDISFKIKTSNIGREKILAFLETELGKELKILQGKIVYDNLDIHLSIPFTIGELGFRRHYRLPSNEMLNKKVLLFVDSENMSASLTQMFHYFSYTVESKYNEIDKVLADIGQYDLVVIEEKLVTEVFASMIIKTQEQKSIKYAVLDDIHRVHNIYSHAVSTHLIKPVTQESIFKLIVTLFEYHDSNKDDLVDAQSKDTESLNDSNKDDLDGIIKEKEKDTFLVLNKKKGMENTAKSGLLYAKELRRFVNTFEGSDLYFRKIVNDKSINQIKEFCIDLEKQAKIIGAESMLKFADTVNLIFVYDKLDMLAIYPGKYHIELDKLLNEIKDYVGR